jgi:hypothetical protein
VGVLQRAWKRLDRFVVGALIFGVGVSVALVLLPAPNDPTKSQQLIRGLVAVGLSLVAALLVTVLYSISVHPREQRDEADKARTRAESERDAALNKLGERPPPPLHAQSLRDTIAFLMNVIADERPIAYGSPDRPALGTGFRVHFPECAQLVDAYIHALALQAEYLVRYEKQFDEQLEFGGFGQSPYLAGEVRGILWSRVKPIPVGQTVDDLEWQYGDDGRVNAVSRNTGHVPVTEPVTKDQFVEIQLALEKVFADGLAITVGGLLPYEAASRLRRAQVAAVVALDEHKDAGIRRRDDCVQCRDL